MDDDSKSTQLTEDEASAALNLTSTPEWQAIAGYLNRCLRASLSDLETLSVDKTPGLVANAQGECRKLRALLSLRERAEKVLEGARNRVKPRV